MSILMYEACKETRKRNMDLKKQVRHIGNKFLNSVEESAQEACYLLLQLPLTKATKDVVFINTSPSTDRTFLLKSKGQLEKLPGNSTQIESDNIVKRYAKRPKQLKSWCLADFVSQLNVKFEKCDSNKSSVDENLYKNDDEYNETESNITDNNGKLKLVLKNGITITERKCPKVIRYVRYSEKVDSAHFYRERLMFFRPWRNEEEDLKQGYDSYKSSYALLQKTIEKKAKQYGQNAQQLNDAGKS